jgi:hypothetical protein
MDSNSGNQSFGLKGKLIFTNDDMDCNLGSGDTGERFSRKVFVGGLPPDIDEGLN